jgi:murein DD-endopeptidase MepM/ murein hydrolase activator NlpD
MRVTAEISNKNQQKNEKSFWRSSWKFAVQIFSVAVICVTAFRFYSDVSQDNLQKENLKLRELLGRSESRLGLLEIQVDSLQSNDDQMRQFAGMESLSDDERDMAVGGAIYEPWPLSYDKFDFVMIEQLEREILLLSQSMIKIKSSMESQIDRLNRVPTIQPVKDGFISSHYGKRIDPFTKKWRTHRGLDFQAPTGTPIMAPADGKVVQAGRVSGFGRVIKIDHGNGILTLYGHMSRIRVKNGQSVKRGDRIGDVGSSGRSTSSHLHYEVRVNGRHVNPNDYLLDRLATID